MLNGSRMLARSSPAMSFIRERNSYLQDRQNVVKRKLRMTTKSLFSISLHFQFSYNQVLRLLAFDPFSLRHTCCSFNQTLSTVSSKLWSPTTSLLRLAWMLLLRTAHLDTTESLFFTPLSITSQLLLQAHGVSMLLSLLIRV